VKSLLLSERFNVPRIASGLLGSISRKWEAAVLTIWFMNLQPSFDIYRLFLVIRQSTKKPGGEESRLLQLIDHLLPQKAAEAYPGIVA